MREILLLAHFIGLIIGAGAAFSAVVIGYLAPRFDAGYRREVLIKLFPLRYVSYLGLLLLIVSGVLLLLPYLHHLGKMPWMWVKLAFVALLVVLSLFGMVQMRRAKQGPDPSVFRKLALAGKLSFISSLVIVTCAVYTFH